MTKLDRSTAGDRRAGSSDPVARLRPGDIDLSDPKTFVAGVPHEYFRVLREQAPVYWQEECRLPGLPKGSGYWALTRYEDVTWVSKNSDLFSSEEGTCVLSDLRPRDLANMREQLINMDMPGHTELRNLMNPPFKPGTVRGTEEHTRRIVRETIEELEGRSECDFVDAVSAPVSLRALAALSFSAAGRGLDVGATGASQPFP